MRARGRHVEGARDGNQPDVTGWYESLGCSVKDCGSIGSGFPDLIVGCAGVTDLAEVKQPGEALRPNQVTFNAAWRGSRPWTVSTLDDVQAHVMHMRRRACRPGRA